MNSEQKTLLESIQKLEKIKELYKEAKADMLEKALKLGVGSHFQDPATKAVYQVIQPTGTFISFDPVSYERTRLPNEKRGSLSLKKAEEMGYNFK